MPGRGRKLTVCHPSVFSPGPGPAVFGHPHHRRNLWSPSSWAIYGRQGPLRLRPNSGPAVHATAYLGPKRDITPALRENGRDRGRRITKGKTGLSNTPPHPSQKLQWGRQYPTIPKKPMGSTIPHRPKNPKGSTIPRHPKNSNGSFMSPPFEKFEWGLHEPTIPKV